MSGGKKQKLLIDILSDADVYLLDEPMIGLGEDAIKKIGEKIIKMIDESKTILIAMPK